MTLTENKEDSMVLILVVMVFVFSITFYNIGIYKGEQHYFNESRALLLIEEKMNDTGKVLGLKQLGYADNLTISEVVSLYYRYNQVSRYCLMREVREICLSSGKS